MTATRGLKRIYRLPCVSRPRSLASLIAGFALILSVGPVCAQTLSALRTSEAPPDALPRDGHGEWVRKELDGGGPALLVRSGGYLLVVDGNTRTVSRYVLEEVGTGSAAVRSCTFDGDFSPWRSVRIAKRTLVVGEVEPLPGKRERQRTLKLDDAWVADMPPGTSQCPKPEVLPAAGLYAEPVERRSAKERSVSVSGFSRGVRFAVSAYPRAVVISERTIGRLSGLRSAVLWKEIDRWPVAGAPATGGEGRVVVNDFLTVFSAAGRPEQTIRIDDFKLSGMPGQWAPPGANQNTAGRSFDGMIKRGFEPFVAASAGGADWLYVMRKVAKGDNGEEGFQLERYPIPITQPTTKVSRPIWEHEFALYHGAGPDPAQDGPTPDSGAIDPDPDEDPQAATLPTSRTRQLRKEWHDLVLTRMQAFSNHEWPMPVRAASRPCSDQCNVFTVPEGDHLALAAGSRRPADAVEVYEAEKGGPLWVSPRQLINATGTQVGIPYSFGGLDLPKGFDQRRAAYDDSAVSMPPPLGQIRNKLSVGAGKLDYPLGLDCSAFVAAIFGNANSDLRIENPLGTTEMIPESGDVLPPLNSFAVPVEHPSNLKPGDMLLKHGHIVVFMGTEWIGARPGRHTSLGYVVYEATSRCGRVCRSVYEPDFFNGWWMFRPKSAPGPDGRPKPNPWSAPVWQSVKPAPATVAPKL